MCWRREIVLFQIDVNLPNMALFMLTYYRLHCYIFGPRPNFYVFWRLDFFKRGILEKVGSKSVGGTLNIQVLAILFLYKVCHHLILFHFLTQMIQCFDQCLDVHFLIIWTYWNVKLLLSLKNVSSLSLNMPWKLR